MYARVCLPACLHLQVSVPPAVRQQLVDVLSSSRMKALSLSRNQLGGLGLGAEGSWHSHATRNQLGGLGFEAEGSCHSHATSYVVG